MTNREITSQLVNILKTNNKDNRMSRRFILNLLQDTANFLISQKWGERSILAETSLYTQIPCFEFESVDVTKCPMVEFRTCSILMKSKCPLPKLIFSRLGASIREIVSLDGDFTFTFVDENQYRRNKKRQHKLKNEVYIYLGSDNHLYIPDREILTLDLTILTTDNIKAEDCSACSDKKPCRNNWEQEFKAPDKLIPIVVSETLKVLGISRNINEDQNPNGLENG